MSEYNIVYLKSSGNLADQTLFPRIVDEFTALVDEHLTQGWKLQGNHNLNILPTYVSLVEYVFTQSIYRD